MKRLLALLLALTLCFALVACSNEKEVSSESDANTTTQTVTESTNNTETSDKPSVTTSKPTENTKTEHAHSYSSATCTAPAECSCGATNGSALGHNFVKGVCSNCDSKAKTQQITITTENWNRYFEVKIINNAKKNNFGDYGTPKDFSISFKLFLKDEYINRLTSIDASIELSYDDYVESYSYDSSTGNYTLTGEESYFMEKFTYICTFTDNDNNYRDGCYFSGGCWGGGDETTGYITRYAKNITSSRAMGTITLISN